MKKINVEEQLVSAHSLMNGIVLDTANILKDAHLVVKLDDLLKERGITQKDLAQMTGMRIGTISELVNGKGISINKVQLFAIMVALRVTNLSDIYEIHLPEPLQQQFKTEQSEWISSKDMPLSIKDMYKQNVLKNAGLDS